jgi:hypothetical protein
MVEQPAYQHTQPAPLCGILYALAVLEFALAWSLRQQPPMPWLFLGIGALIFVLAASFHYLTVVDLGDRLLIAFGPLPVFRRTIRYADIISAEVGRTSILDGWGIHWRAGRGWLWNIWGRDCVVVRLQKGALRIGSDDAANLAQFLQERAR